MSDGPAEPPRIEVLLLRADWSRDPVHFFDAPYTHDWKWVDLLHVRHYINIGYLPIVADPVSEAAYRQWQKDSEDAA